MWALVVAAISLLVKVFSSRIGIFIASALAWLGLSFTTYKVGVEGLRTLIGNELGNAGFLMDWMGFFAVDKAITIVLSAIAVKYAAGSAKAFLTRKAA